MNVTENKQGEDTPVEDRLRAAVRAYVPDHSTPPLRLTPQRTPRARRLGWGGWWPGGRWQGALGWAVPLAAAAAVVAVIVASLVITRGPGGRGPNSPPAAAGGAVVPPYYVSAWSSVSNPHAYVEVRATSTSAVQATVDLPSPYNDNPGVLAAAANDRVFLVAGRNREGTQRAFLLRFTPGGEGHGATQLTPLAVPVPGYTDVAFALSPNGTMLAGVDYRTQGSSLTIYNLVTGTKRTWTGYAVPGHSWFGSLAWSGDGRSLQFSWWTYGRHEDRASFGRLNPSAPGTTLPAPRSTITTANGIQMQLLTDGHLSVVVTSKSRWLDEIFSPRGGAPVVIPIWGKGGAPVTAFVLPLWSSDTGETMILGTSTPPLKMGVWRGRHYQPLTVAPAFRKGIVPNLAW